MCCGRDRVPKNQFSLLLVKLFNHFQIPKLFLEELIACLPVRGLGVERYLCKLATIVSFTSTNITLLKKNISQCACKKDFIYRHCFWASAKPLNWRLFQTVTCRAKTSQTIANTGRRESRITNALFECLDSIKIFHIFFNIDFHDSNINEILLI